MSTIAWHEQARALRRAGKTLEEIGNMLGFTGERVRQVCVGVVCPVDHRALTIQRLKDPEWRRLHPRPAVRRYEGAEFIRAHYCIDMKAADIAAALGITRNAVIGRARDLGLGNRFQKREAA